MEPGGRGAPTNNENPDVLLQLMKTGCASITTAWQPCIVSSLRRLCMLHCFLDASDASGSRFDRSIVVIVMHPLHIVYDGRSAVLPRTLMHAAYR